MRRVLRVYCDTSVCVTIEDYEKMVQDLQVKQMTDTLTLGDQILAVVLHDMHWRYCEILYTRKMANEANP